MTLRSGAVLSAALLCTACSRPVSDAECLQLVERYGDLLLKTNNPEISAAELSALSGEVRHRALSRPDLTRCGGQVSRSEWECAMSAPTVDDIERCLL